MKQYILLLFLIFNSFAQAKNNSENILGARPTVHVISIGFGSEYAISDSKALIEKIKNNPKTDIVRHKLDSRLTETSYDISLSFNVYNLTDENVTVSEIRKALKEIIIQTNTNDFFYILLRRK